MDISSPRAVLLKVRERETSQVPARHNIWAHRWQYGGGVIRRFMERVGRGGDKRSQTRRFPIHIRNFCPRVEAASALGITGDNSTHETTEEGTRSSLPDGRPSSALPSTFVTNGRFITLRPSPNSRVAHSNAYEKRFRYSYPADGPRAQLAQPEIKAVARATPNQWQKRRCLIPEWL